MIRQTFPQITFACKKKKKPYIGYLVPSSEETPLLGGRAGNTATRTHHSRAQRHGRSRVKGRVLLEEERGGEVIDSRPSFQTRQVQTRRSCQRKEQAMFCFFSETEIQKQKATTKQNKKAVVEVGNHIVCTDRRNIWSRARDRNPTQNEKRGTRKNPGTWKPQCNSGVL